MRRPRGPRARRACDEDAIVNGFKLERFHGLLDAEKRSDLDWLVETTKNRLVAPILFGYCTAIAVEHQAWTWWEVLREARRKFIVKATVQ